MYGYPINNFTKNKKFYVNNIQIVGGNEKNIATYMNYLKKLSNIGKFEKISKNAFLFEIKLNKNHSYYKNIYSPLIFYPSPIIHQNGKEIITIASWDRKVLQNIIENVEKNENTSAFKLLSLTKSELDSFFIPQILPKLTKNQMQMLRLAKREGYWEYPKKSGLTNLAKLSNKSKSTTHEILKRAEAKLLNYYV
jgi:predicted DNA binding protein